jgi:ferredoxin
MLRKVILLLEDQGWTAVPVHNPFGPHAGRPVKPGGVKPDGDMSLRVIGCAAGLGELGHSKLFLTPRFGPRQRMFAVLTDAQLVPDPMLEGHICDDCGACVRSCPGAIPAARTIKFTLGGREFGHADVNFKRCTEVHQGWDPKYTPFLKPDSTRDNPPPYYKFVDHRFRHRSICGARGCVRACVDHLEKCGKISAKYHTPMIEGKQWTMDDAP